MKKNLQIMILLDVLRNAQKNVCVEYVSVKRLFSIAAA